MASAAESALEKSKTALRAGSGVIVNSATAAADGPAVGTFSRIAASVPYVPQFPVTPQPLSIITAVYTVVPYMYQALTLSWAFIFGVFSAFYFIYIMASFCGLCMAGTFMEPVMFCARGGLLGARDAEEKALTDAAKPGPGKSFSRYFVSYAGSFVRKSFWNILVGIFSFMLKVFLNFGILAVQFALAVITATVASNQVAVVNLMDFTVSDLVSIGNYGGGIYNVLVALADVFLIPWNVNVFFSVETFHFLGATIGVSVFNSFNGQSGVPGETTADFFSGNRQDLMDIGNTFGRRVLQSAATPSPTTRFATSLTTDYDAGPDVQKFMDVLGTLMRFYGVIIDVVYSVLFFVFKIIWLILLPVVEVLADTMAIVANVVACAMASPECFKWQLLQSALDAVFTLFKLVADFLNSLGVFGTNFKISTPEVQCTAANFDRVPCNCATSSGGIYPALTACSQVQYDCYLDTNTGEWVEYRTQSGVRTELVRGVNKAEVCYNTRRVLRHDDALALVETHGHAGCFYACVNGTQFESCPLSVEGVIWTGETCESVNAHHGRSLFTVENVVPLQKSAHFLKDTFEHADDVVVTPRRSLGTTSATTTTTTTAPNVRTHEDVARNIKELLHGRSTISDGRYSCTIPGGGLGTKTGMDAVDDYLVDQCISHATMEHVAREFTSENILRKYLMGERGGSDTNQQQYRVFPKGRRRMEAHDDDEAPYESIVASAIIRASDIFRVRAKRYVTRINAARESSKSPAKLHRRVLEDIDEITSAGWPQMNDVVLTLHAYTGFTAVGTYTQMAYEMNRGFRSAVEGFSEHLAVEARRKAKRGMMTTNVSHRRKLQDVVIQTRSPTDRPTTFAPSTPPSVNKIGVFGSDVCPTSYLCPDGVTCVPASERSLCPYPDTNWLPGIISYWILQVSIVLENLTIQNSVAVFLECWNIIVTDPMRNPVSLVNVALDPRTNPNKPLYCPPMIMQWPLPRAKASEFDFKTALGEWCSAGVNSDESAVAPCECPQYYVNIFDSDMQWFAGIPFFALAILHNGALAGLFWFTLVATRGSPLDAFVHFMLTPATLLGLPAWIPSFFGDQGQPGTLNQQIFCASINSYAVFTLILYVQLFIYASETIVPRLALVLYDLLELVNILISYAVERLLVERYDDYDEAIRVAQKSNEDRAIANRKFLDGLRAIGIGAASLDVVASKALSDMHAQIAELRVQIDALKSALSSAAVRRGKSN